MANPSTDHELLLIVGASGKLGFATLSTLLDRQLLPASRIACTTSSEQGAKKLAAARQQGVEIRHASWDDSLDSWVSTLHQCTKLFLISSARIEKDFGDAPDGQGREADHIRVLEAALRAGVAHVYYTSLAFANPSLSRVMKAHERTELWLQQHKEQLPFTILREGLYNESWPLYFGHYDVKNDERSEVVVAGDGAISWTSIANLGVANAAILAASRHEWNGKTCYLSRTTTFSLEDIAKMVSHARGRNVQLKVTTRDTHDKYYENERGMDQGMVTWWSRTFDALREQECDVQDPTLEGILEAFGVPPDDMIDTVNKMVANNR